MCRGRRGVCIGGWVGRKLTWTGSAVGPSSVWSSSGRGPVVLLRCSPVWNICGAYGVRSMVVPRGVLGTSQLVRSYVRRGELPIRRSLRGVRRRRRKIRWLRMGDVVDTVVHGPNIWPARFDDAFPALHTEYVLRSPASVLEFQLLLIEVDMKLPDLFHQVGTDDDVVFVAYHPIFGYEPHVRINPPVKEQATYNVAQPIQGGSVSLSNPWVCFLREG